MFIICGKSDTTKLRVLDTSDMITEEVDMLEIKSIQSLGYEVITDYSYDYAYEFSKCLSSYHVSSEGKDFNATEYFLVTKLSEINDKFGVGLDNLTMRKSFWHDMRTFYPKNAEGVEMLNCFLFALGDNGVVTIKCVVVCKFGVFLCSFGLEEVFDYSRDTLEFFISCTDDLSLEITCYIEELSHTEHYKVTKFCKEVIRYKEGFV